LIIAKLQHDLETIYRLGHFPSIENFLISAHEIKVLLPQEEKPNPQVLFRQEHDEIFLAVFLGEETVARLEANILSKSLLSDFCSAAEEISHFLYLSWSANNEKPISLLDIELQGEIDKFLLASQYFSDEENLFGRMFDQISFHERLDESSLDRYVEANRLGGKFVKTLGKNGDTYEIRTCPQILAKLRAFYRLNSQTRLSHIETL